MHQFMAFWHEAKHHRLKSCSLRALIFPRRSDTASAFNISIGDVSLTGVTQVSADLMISADLMTY